ncbi:SDR family NAD(P)-dependent oxidoreductase [Emcibacter nanhaiensis]|uniref:SDR family NAD(P)-dependent oxidoreductase n=1 Tax=Emcibacter nanhaiensis TaxID=1505037 RepID=A0A501PJP8_9PROT|nr:SDR family NAD(P)-dependent oxidoreductase [Emcibacter nanhaiensis]TPD60730.1 SDR family NAD(P)-dependent oxidoreductase [Emcibacter nanhaiensis]
MEAPSVALVTGASRGAGRGIALALGEKGMTVYVTGRSETEGSALGWDGTPLPGTIHQTAEEITAAGGKGIAVACDHSDDDQVAALFERIAREEEGLDILFNSATYMHPQLIEDKPFYEKELAAVEILNVGLRSAYVASWHAARLMVPRGRGLIAFGSSFGATCYMHGPGYGAQKAGLDKFAHDMAVDLDGTGVRTVSIWMGPLLTERARIAAELHPELYREFHAMAETPEFTGRIVHALASDPEGGELSGQTLIGAEICNRYGITDRDGRVPPSHRDMLGAPLNFSPAIVR